MGVGVGVNGRICGVNRGRELFTMRLYIVAYMRKIGGRFFSGCIYGDFIGVGGSPWI